MLLGHQPARRCIDDTEQRLELAMTMAASAAKMARTRRRAYMM